jgi:hypothetical protein
MRVRSNGGIIGPRNAATSSAASGIWSMPEQESFVSGSLWPLWVQYYYNSVQFNGSSQYLTIPANAAFAFGTGDFTVEAWVYQTARGGTSTYGPQIAGCQIYGTSADWFFNISLSGTLYFEIGSSSTGAILTTSAVPLNTWTHVACVRSSGIVTIYINGVNAGGSASYTTSVTNASTPLSIGGPSNGSAAAMFTGYISNLRIIKGTALYTTAFTPPTIPLSAVSGTSLLTCNSPTIVDNSTNALTITNNGTATVSSTNPFGSYATMFNGSSQYIDMPNNAALSQVPPWTIEMWIYPTAVNVNCYLFGQTTNSWAYLNINTNGYLIVDRAAVSSVITSSSPLVANTWYHIALVADGTNLKLYINGVQSGSTVAWTLSVASAAITRIGAYQNGGSSGSLFFPGYIYNLRYIKGTALYTSNFTPPTSTLTAITNTSLLTCQYQELFDASTNNLLLTPTGTPSFTKTSLPF